MAVGFAKCFVVLLLLAKDFLALRRIFLHFSPYKSRALHASHLLELTKLRKVRRNWKPFVVEELSF